MKYFPYILLSLSLLPMMVIGQTYPNQDQNYVRQISYQTELKETQVVALNAANSSVDNDKKVESIVYYDGLGRPKQRVAIRAGSNREDLVTPILYDNLGRQPRDYLPLPLAGNKGAFNSNLPFGGQPGIISDLADYYQTKFPEDLPQGILPAVFLNPFSEKRFENSPLNRVLEQAAPGFDWKLGLLDGGHTIKFGFGTNTANEVRNFYVFYGPNGEPDLRLRQDNSGNYPKQTLFKNIVRDENWTSSDGTIGTTIEFTNKLGQVVLKRVRGLDPAIPLHEDRSLNHDTYYVYDDYGNLVFVLSPEGTRKIVVNNTLAGTKAAILNDLCYQYRYDHRNRLVWKKIPGKGYETILYNNLNLPILTQDANMRQENSAKYLFTKYDALGRVAYTGFYTAAIPRSSVEDSLRNRLPATLSETQRTAAQGPRQIGDSQVYYSNSSFPSDNLEVLTINYYDRYVDYAIPGNPLSLPVQVLGQNTTEHPSVTTTTQGLPTVSRVRVLGQTPARWTTSLTAYDSRGRAIYSDTYNEYLGSRDKALSKLEPISGRASETQTTHIKNGKTVTVVDYFTYDHMGRMLSQQQQIGNTPVQLIAKNDYDELGQLAKKKVGGETAVDGYTDIENIDVTFDGTVVHSSTAYNWPSRLKTRGKVIGDGGLSFKVEGNNNHVRAGLLRSGSGSGNTGNSYLDYGFYLKQENNVYKVYIVNNGADQPTSRLYAPGDTFTVARNANQIVYRHNTVLIATKPYVGTVQEALTGKVAFSGPGGSISGLGLFGPKIDKILQNVSYRYNIRGWLTDINNVEMGNIGPEIKPLFNFRIGYNKVEGNATARPLYNGNISQTLWKTQNEDKNIRGYGYSYDRLNRILGADSYRGTKLADMAATAEHDVQGIGYDLNGNIQTLARFGADNGTVPTFGMWDALDYTYNGNQLVKVADNSQSTLHKNLGFSDGTNTGDDYLYDDNGNMTTDMNKGIVDIAYNHLNLPVKIDFSGLKTVIKEINYIYDATGAKLEKRVTEAGATVSTQYADGFVYNNAEDGTMKLQFFSHPEGYVEPVSEGQRVKGFDIGGPGVTYSSYKYVFQYKDHLGNVRLSYSDTDLNGSINPLTEILDEKNYYPFGLQQKGYNNNVSPSGNALAQQFGYNGKELEESLGINWLEYGARNYDASIGRFMNIDRMAEMYEVLSPYNYTGNNPVNFIDVNGEWIYINDGDNRYRYENGQTQHNVDGQWTAIDETVELSDDAISTIAGLNHLENSGNTGKNLVNHFSNDKNNVDFNFVDGQSPIYKDGTISLDPSANTEYFVQGNNGPELKSSPLFINIGHELAHAQDPTKFYGSSWYNRNVSESEIRASHIENQLRAESGLPLRTHYGVSVNGKTGETTPSAASTLIDSQGNSVYYSRSKKRVSYPIGADGKREHPNSGGIRDGKNANGGEILKARYNYNERNGG